MKMLPKFGLIAVTAIAFATPAFAQDRGTAEEAQELLNQAVQHYEEVGREQALQDFNDPQGEFVDRDLYVFCVGPDDMMTAHGGNPDLIGMDVTTLQDAEGQEIGNRIIEIGRTEGEGTLEYKFENPMTGEVEDKATFIQSVGEEICAVGYYQ